MNQMPMTPQLQTFDGLVGSICLNCLDVELLIRDWHTRQAWGPVQTDKLKRARMMLDTAIQAIDEALISVNNRVTIHINEAAE